MPESPEVRIITEQLSSALTSSTIKDIAVIGGRFLKSPPDHLKEIKQTFPTRIKEIKCKGKFIWFGFENDWYLFNTLGMTGSWSFEKQKHSALHIRMDEKNVFFFDPRHFGTIKFAHGTEVLNTKLNSLGPDLLDKALSDINPKHLVRKQLQNRPDGETLTESLMNQKVFAGIGNYIKSESLYRAKLSPWRNSNTLTNEEYFALSDALTKVMFESYHAGGNTIATYKDVSGKIGSYSSYLQVYGKIKDPLGNQVKKQQTYDKRTSWWVPEIQK